uniref:Serine/arginine-rich splicing factor 7 n=1 Tax=Timema bartmani TaxID=61472 RepID=A0A7R9ESA3_9NEOP|nr:unnamed protein product [Timema bartmani]
MSRYRDSGSSECKLYVGDLDRGGRSSGSAASKQELEEAFSYYGPLRNVWVARNPPGFAFVEFEDPRDAEDAVRGLDGRTICGRRVRVEPSNGMGGKGRFRGPPPRRGRPFHPEDRCYECGERGHYARDCYRYRGSRGGRRRYVGVTSSRVYCAKGSFWTIVDKGSPTLVQGQGHDLEIVARVLAQPPVQGPGTGAALSHVHLETGPEHPRTGRGLAVLVYAPAPETVLAQPTPTAARRPVRGADKETLPVKSKVMLMLMLMFGCRARESADRNGNTQNDGRD